MADEVKSENKSILAKIWGFFRWPILAGFLLIALVIFFVGLVFNFGYSGTTSIRAMSINDSPDRENWNKFMGLFGPAKGKPYDPTANATLEALQKKVDPQKDIVGYDRRLVRELTYLASGNQQNQKCGWNGLFNSQHDRLVLQTDNVSSDNSNPQGTDTSKPSANLQSSSTLKRGVGVRINGADYVKCSYQKRLDPQNNCDNFWRKYGQYPILFSSSSRFYGESILPQPVISPQCTIERIACAVDYYPNLPSAADIAPGEQLNGANPQTSDVNIISNLNPAVKDDFLTGLSIDDGKLRDFARQAAVYKIAQLTLQLLATDEPGCENSAGNIGNQRNIPFTIILPQWAAKVIRNTQSKIVKDNFVWFDFLNIASGQFPGYMGLPYNLQTESPTAGISFDDRLNTQGLHFNY